jgi:hypothetical protein
MLNILQLFTPMDGPLVRLQRFLARHQDQTGLTDLWKLLDSKMPGLQLSRNRMCVGVGVSKNNTPIISLTLPTMGGSADDTLTNPAIW